MCRFCPELFILRSKHKILRNDRIFYSYKYVIYCHRKIFYISEFLADKGSTSVVLNIEDKIKEGQTQLDNREHYRPLVNPLVFNSLLADSILETTEMK